MRSERGSGTVWVLTMIALIWALVMAGVAVGAARVARHRAGVAADLAALAGAARLPGAAVAACAEAARVAALNHARLRACVVDASEIEVSVVTRSRRGWRSPAASARSRAGPVVP
ncbi:MAG: hypothetical protein GEV11_04050 [Streptosporangiales bacterium]|nr:hypothetical protein [Streptosporangiales bacterium]